MPAADMDAATLEPRLRPFVGDGSSAPRWTPFTVPVDGKHVLVVDIDPPRWGDPVYVLRTRHVNWEPGQVFVRHKGSVDRPTAADMDALNERVAGGTLHEVQVDLIAASGLNPPRPFRLDNEELESLILARRSGALNSLRPVKQDETRGTCGGPPDVLSYEELLAGSAPDFRSSLSGMPPDEPDTRTESEYRAEVDRYISQCERDLPRVALWRLFEHRLAEVVVVATNLTQRPLASVEIRVHFPGNVHELKPTRVDKPVPPWPFGKPEPHQDLYVPQVAYPPAGDRLLSRPSRPRPIVTDGGSVDIKYPQVDLRAETPHQLDGVAVLIDPGLGPRLGGEWTATSTVASGVARGTVEVAVGEALTLDELLSLPRRRR
ncbi:MAG: hypothetical protein LC749_01635 [Actinobacteria bacterium]|nr:hypothetical protein [Actinomycetota bacterium]